MLSVDVKWQLERQTSCLATGLLPGLNEERGQLCRALGDAHAAATPAGGGFLRRALRRLEAGPRAVRPAMSS